MEYGRVTRPMALALGKGKEKETTTGEIHTSKQKERLNGNIPILEQAASRATMMHHCSLPPSPAASYIKGALALDGTDALPERMRGILADFEARIAIAETEVDRVAATAHDALANALLVKQETSHRMAEARKDIEWLTGDSDSDSRGWWRRQIDAEGDIANLNPVPALVDERAGALDDVEWGSNVAADNGVPWPTMGSKRQKGRAPRVEKESNQIPTLSPSGNSDAAQFDQVAEGVSSPSQSHKRVRPFNVLKSPSFARKQTRVHSPSLSATRWDKERRQLTRSHLIMTKPPEDIQRRMAKTRKAIDHMAHGANAPIASDSKHNSGPRTRKRLDEGDEAQAVPSWSQMAQQKRAQFAETFEKPSQNVFRGRVLAPNSSEDDVIYITPYFTPSPSPKQRLSNAAKARPSRTSRLDQGEYNAKMGTRS